MKPVERIMLSAPVIPVLVVHDPADAQPIARALVAGGLNVLEVTLRTPAALDVIREMKRVDGAIVGAGTVVDELTLDQAIEAGAEFIVAPGLTERLGLAAVERTIPFLPGIVTAGELMRGLDLGLEHFKFFPAETSGGLPALKALCGPFKHVKFCPTGGIRSETAAAWLAHEQVLCVGGSWLVPNGPIDLAAIEANARKAASLSAGLSLRGQSGG